MITHQEAEILTSARQDAPLDPLVERELQAHLATCDQCRAFAAATERLTAGLRSLPTLPASPRVRREVLEQARRGRNPLAVWWAGIAPNMSMGSALATVATVLVLGFLGWFALDRVFLDNNGDDNPPQIAAVPTAEPFNLTAEVVATNPPTPPTTAAETEVATEPATKEATEPPTEKATDVATEPPTEKATDVSTEAPTEKATDVVTEVPTEVATEVPTEVPTEARVEKTQPPVETTVPTETETSTDAVVDLTGTDEATKEAETSAQESTQAAVRSAMVDATAAETNAEASTPAPTETEEPIAPSTPAPTQTGEPTPTSTPEPTATETPEPTATVSIEPIGPTETETAVVEAPTEAPADTATVEETSPPIEPADGTEGATNVAEVEQANDDDTGAAIEPIDDAASTPGVGGTTGDVSTDQTSTSKDLLDASDSYTGIAGDPANKLGLTQEGRLEFVNVPDGALFATSDGFVLTTPDSQPSPVQLCTDTYCEPALDAPDDATWVGDIAMGVVDGQGYVLRKYSDRSEIIVGTPSGTQLTDASVVLDFGPTGSPDAVYESNGALYAWVQTNQWVQMSGGGAQLLSGGYTDPVGVRFAPRADRGPMMGYFSGGTLVISSVSSPDSPILVFDSGAVDFDISPSGKRIAVTDGSGITIYDDAGNQLVRYDGGDARPSSVIWLRSGIVWVDATTGSLYQIPETAAD